ncbi:hypothetical protein VPH35_134664 [Triticum aestivum]
MMRAAGGAGAGVVPFLVRWLGRRMAWWPPVVPPAAPGDPLVSPCRWDGYCGAGGGVLVLDLASGFGRVVRVGQQPGMVVAPALGSGAGRSDAWTVSSWWRGRYTVARRLCSRRRPASSPASARLQANRFNLHFISSSSGRYSHMVLSQLRSTARLAPGAAGPNSSHTRCAAGPSSSRARCSRTDLVPLLVLQDRARLALGEAGRVDGCQFWPAYWVSTLGRPRVRKVGPFRSPLSLGCGGSQVRWCQGLGCRVGGPGGGRAVLLGRTRALVLPGLHGCVGGVVAGVWRSVAVSVG